LVDQEDVVSPLSVPVTPARAALRGAAVKPLLTAFLYVSSDELLGVLLQYGVDLVEQVVDVLAQLLVPFGHFGIDLGSRSLVGLVA
jgi:hypothetical protein